MLQPKKFPQKPRYSMKTLQRNFMNKNSTFHSTAPVHFQKLAENPFNELQLGKMVEEEILTQEQADEILKKSNYVIRNRSQYIPYHGYKHPGKPLPKYVALIDQIIEELEEDNQELFGVDTALPIKYVDLLYKMCSYEFASKEEKQANLFNDMLAIVIKNVTPALRPSEIADNSNIYHLIWQTATIRNLQEDFQELYAIKRHETLRDETEAYEQKRWNIIELRELRSKTLVKIKRANIDHYYQIMQILNIDNVEPCRRTLNKWHQSHHERKRENAGKYSRIDIDLRIRDPQYGKSPIRMRSNTIDYNDHHVITYLEKHVAQVIDMRIRTFAEMERLGKKLMTDRSELKGAVAETSFAKIDSYLEESGNDEKLLWEKTLNTNFKNGESQLIEEQQEKFDDKNYRKENVQVTSHIKSYLENYKNM